MGTEPTEDELRAIEVEQRRERTMQDLATARRVATGMAMRGEINVRAYRGISLKLACSYAEQNATNEALSIVSDLAPIYLDEEFVEDTQADAELLAASERLAAWLVVQGHVDEGAADGACFHVMEAGRA